jgi:hypothetical protein
MIGKASSSAFPSALGVAASTAPVRDSAAKAARSASTADRSGAVIPLSRVQTTTATGVSAPATLIRSGVPSRGAEAES